VVTALVVLILIVRAGMSPGTGAHGHAAPAPSPGGGAHGQAAPVPSPIPAAAVRARLLPSGVDYPLPAASARNSFGVNAQFLFDLLSPSIWALHGRLIKAEGIQVVRVDAPWGQAEPNPPGPAGHRYDWTYFDSIELTLAGARLRWLPTLLFSAPWDASEHPAGVDPKLFPPLHPGYFAQFGAALVARYGPGGAFWRLHPYLPDLPVQSVEVWNEENTPTFWSPAPNAAAYLRLYEATRAAVHAVAPAVEVMVGGLAKPASDFLNELYAAAGQQADLFDSVAIHPYGATTTDVLAEVESARRTLDAHGDIDTPLEITEFGWPITGNGATVALPTLTSSRSPTRWRDPTAGSRASIRIRG
jgi:hypothetical protein